MRRRDPLLAGLSCAVLGFAWQALTVHFNYRGNWTALFCHGSQHPLPASLAWEHIYIFPNSGGYDGQSYHYVAHDPLCRTDICKAVPDPRRRYPRILVPGLAYLLALGRQEWIDGAFFAVNLGFLFLGAYWLAQLCKRPMWAVAYVLVPASIASLDRMVVDLSLASLCLGFAIAVRDRRPVKLWMILAAAALCREAGFLLFVAYAVVELSEKRWRAVVYATALIPAIMWNVWTNAGGFGAPIPFAGLADAVLHPRQYAFASLATVLVRGLDWVQLAGLVLAMAYGFKEWRRVTKDAIAALAFLWACFAIAIPPGTYDDPLAGARILTPLMLTQWLAGFRLPLLLASPRVYAQLAPQVWGVLRGLF
ncbi:MAG TPA: hypothetical protein VKE70_07765 [Candidatus Solibacter sp.]|nr:hypothetical protein [Candidatus Solibacter sp.]